MRYFVSESAQSTLADILKNIHILIGSSIALSRVGLFRLWVSPGPLHTVKARQRGSSNEL